MWCLCSSCVNQHFVLAALSFSVFLRKAFSKVVAISLMSEFFRYFKNCVSELLSLKTYHLTRSSSNSSLNIRQLWLHYKLWYDVSNLKGSPILKSCYQTPCRNTCNFCLFCLPMSFTWNIIVQYYFEVNVLIIYLWLKIEFLIDHHCKKNFLIFSKKAEITDASTGHQSE